MVISFTRLSWLWLKGKNKEQIPNNSSLNPPDSLIDGGLGLRGEAKILNLPSSVKRDERKGPFSSNKLKRKKWKSREDRTKRIYKEYDVVLVPSDGVCLSDSESDDSDWSIGWLEPHAPGFMSDDDSFAVLVPCYRHDCREMDENVQVLSVELLSAVNKYRANDYSSGSQEYMERWLSSLQNF